MTVVRGAAVMVTILPCQALYSECKDICIPQGMFISCDDSRVIIYSFFLWVHNPMCAYRYM